MWQCWSECLRKAMTQMPVQSPLHQVVRVAPAVVAMILLACGGKSSSPSPDVGAPGLAAAADPGDAGLPTKPLDGGTGTKDDSGLGTKDDSGVGTKDDGGLGTKDDSGLGTEDAGPGAEGAGPGTEDAGNPASPDAGGNSACFACAEDKCGILTNACLGSPACVEESQCNLACLGGTSGGTPGEMPGGGPFGFRGLECFESCAKDALASQHLLAAVTCAYTLCPRECLPCAGGGGGPQSGVCTGVVGRAGSHF